MIHPLFHSTSLSAAPRRNQVVDILQTAIWAVDPAEAIKKAVVREGSSLTVGDRTFDLLTYQRIFLVGAGKASIPMARSLEGILGDCLEQGVLITKDSSLLRVLGRKENLDHTVVFEAGHPIPDQRSVTASQKVIELLAGAGEHDLVFCLISGGGSALLTAPVVGISLADQQNLTDSLLRSGASINQMNTLRKHLDQVKGGGLARMAAPAQLITLILSDVIGDPLDVIASGPTAPDPTTYADCWSILEQYELQDKIPNSVQNYLQKGLKGVVEETLKPGDPIFQRVHSQIIANNYQAATAAVEKAASLGFNTLLLTSFLQGEARTVGQTFASIARQVHSTGEPVRRPACVIAGGETTVTVKGSGKGGRNQELALGSVEELRGIPDVMLIALATDGGDGPTDAAGAVVTGETFKRAADKNLTSADYLHHNDAYSFFDKLDDLLKTGSTQTNVNDLTFLILF
jgi:hydroxypyruvate reductase